MPLTLKFADVKLAPPERRPNQWRGCLAEHVTLPSNEDYGYDITGEAHYLALHDIRLQDGELSVDGLATDRTHDLRGAITFLPKGCRASGWSRPQARENSFTALYFHPDLMHHELEARYASATPGPAAYQRNTHLQATLLKLENLLRQPRVDPLQAESLSLLAALEVLGIAVAPTCGQLSKRQLSDVRAYIDAHLQDQISLSDLAGVAGLSRYHFSRAFKNATGCSPHRFVARLRVDSAARMLLGSVVPIEDIAVRCGFNSSAHLRRAFHSQIGCSPSSYRRQSL